MGVSIMPGFSNKPIIIDAREHLMGRLAAIVAKALLTGHKVRVLRCEQMEISGTFFRNKLKFLRAFEGVPPRYQKVKKQVAPHAMRSICLAPGRKYCTVGRISHEVGWKYQDVIETLENKRKLKASVAYGKKGVLQKTRRAAFRAVSQRIAAHQKVVHALDHK